MSEQERSNGSTADVRRRRDPNAPKRNLPPYLWFSKDEYSKIQQEIPDEGRPGLTFSMLDQCFPNCIFLTSYLQVSEATS